MLNMNFEQNVVIDTNNQEWLARPNPGVWRKSLARENAERDHAMSIVRYLHKKVFFLGSVPDDCCLYL